MKTLTRDVQSLLDHSSFIASKLTYLQDATLGLINIEQNNIIKIMSVAAMVFLPPTLIASIYGHELPLHAGTGLADRLFRLADLDGDFRRCALCVVQAAGLAVSRWDILLSASR